MGLRMIGVHRRLIMLLISGGRRPLSAADERRFTPIKMR